MPASVAAAGDTPDAAMMAPVHRWIQAFNAAKTPLPEDIFSDDVVITDQFEPYVWSGRAAMHTWSERLNHSLTSSRVKDEHVARDSPRTFMIDKAGDRASFVIPAALTYVLDGKPGAGRALWLFVVVKSGSGWKVAADTWTRSE